MAYKVRCSKRADRNYDLSYGKGSKKMTTILRRDTKLGWEIDGKKFESKKKALADWAMWAEAEYGAVSRESTAQTASAENAVTASAPEPGEIPVIGDFTWAQAFAVLANKKSLTPSQRHDLKLLLTRLLKEEQPKPVQSGPPKFTPGETVNEDSETPSMGIQ